MFKKGERVVIVPTPEFPGEPRKTGIVAKKQILPDSVPVRIAKMVKGRQKGYYATVVGYLPRHVYRIGDEPPRA